jgi:2-methylcitrate dehydratase PrpD
MAARLAGFTVSATIPAPARVVAARAFLDTVGVALAGIAEPVARLVQARAATDSRGSCIVPGTPLRVSATDAACCHATAAHALDFDDMCFVSLAHPSAPLVPALLAAGETTGASGRTLLDAYVAAFEIEARLGRAMNPRHYQRGWHCTSTLGTIGAAAGCARVLGLDVPATARALGAAASMSAGLKVNFGTMVKPLQVGLAARAGLLAALLARDGLTSSDDAFESSQGFVHAMDGAVDRLDDEVADLGTRWEILDTGVTVKLYPSCAGTHPTIDVLLDLRAELGLTADAVESIRVGVDAITPTVLAYADPASDLEAKFSMPFCAAAAIVFGRVGIDTFEDAARGDPRVRALGSRVTMEVDDTLDGSAPPLTQAHVRVRLLDGREVVRRASGARGYPARPASEADLRAKFEGCAARALPPDRVARAYDALRDIDATSDVRVLTAAFGRT